MQTAVSTQKSEVLFLGMKHIERLLLRRHPRTTKRMKSSLEIKLRSRHSPVLVKQIPLIPSLVKMAEDFNAQLERRASLKAKNAQKDAKASFRGAQNLTRKISGEFVRLIPNRNLAGDAHRRNAALQREESLQRDQPRRRVVSESSSVTTFASNTSHPGMSSLMTLSNAAFDHQREGDTGSGTRSLEMTDLENRVRTWLNKDFKSVGQNPDSPKVNTRENDTFSSD